MKRCLNSSEYLIDLLLTRTTYERYNKSEPLTMKNPV